MQGPHTTDSLVENCHLELTQIIKKKKTLELFLPSSPPAALHSYTCKLTQGNSTYALPRGKRKIQELQLCHFPTEVKTKKPSSNFTWPQRSKGTQTRGKHSCPQHTVQSYIKDLSGYFFSPFHHLIVPAVIQLRLLLSLPMLTWPCQQRLGDQQGQNQNAWIHLKTLVYVPYIKGEGKAKWNIAEATCPAPSWSTIRAGMQWLF